MTTTILGRVDHTEHYRNRTIVAVELPANVEAFTYGDVVQVSLVPNPDPELPPATDEGNWLDNGETRGP